LPAGVRVVALEVIPAWQPAFAQAVEVECGGAGGLAWHELHVATAPEVHVGAVIVPPTPSWQYVPAHVFDGGSYVARRPPRVAAKPSFTVALPLPSG